VHQRTLRTKGRITVQRNLSAELAGPVVI